MTKRVLDIGNCRPDHRAIAALIEANFDATVSQAHRWEDAAAQLRAESFDLVLVNRKLDVDHSDGLELIQRLKQDPQLSALPVMMITNFAEHQRLAVQAGAVMGFGKQSLQSAETLKRFEPYLS
jgi:CheY-like chemotaxis protein